jgi:gamma-glutamyltranspeptidase/glutathione hydrolase
MKIRLISLVCLFWVSSCQNFSNSKSGEGRGADYSENHLDFKKWERTPECCTASGVKAAVASGGTHSSKAGIEILKAGGNVIDAAVATAFVLAVERPHSAGLGGGGFMTLYLKGKAPAASFVDFREMAPEKATRDMYLDKKGEVIPNLSVVGPLSVATPGFVTGLNEIHKKWGKLPWRRLLTPAIELASNGFKIYPSLAQHIIEKSECLLKDPEATKLLLPGKKPLKLGELLVQRDLANTLRRIAQNGGEEFKSGKTAQEIDRYMRSNKGILSARDLKSYKVKYREPILGTFKGFEVISAAPPSAGGVLILQALKILEGFSIEELSQKTPEYTHLISEILKRGYADRSKFVGDPDFTQLDYSRLTSPNYIGALRKNISMDRATPSAEIKGGELLDDKTHTTHLSIIDNEGNAVSSTLTINNTFGACVIAPGTGVFLNDEMDDFSAKPGAMNIFGLTGEQANEIVPLKRPASSMSPTIVLKEGKPVLVVGAAGGSRITTSVLQVILNDLFVYPGNLKRAVFAPRLHQQWVPEYLDLEEGFSEKSLNFLESIGEKIRKAPWSAITQATQLDSDGKVLAVFDPRDEGGAEAY